MSRLLRTRMSASRGPRRPAAGALVLGLVLAACGGASAPPLTDPVAILRAGAASLGTLTTVHVRGAIDGEVAIGLGPTGGGGPIALDGTTIDGDIDVAGDALSVEVVAPALLNQRIDLVVKDAVSYLKAPIVTGQRWVREPAGQGVGADPGSILEGLSAFLARPELLPEKLADTRCAGADCYAVRSVVPAAEVRAALGTLGSSVPGLGDAVGDVTVTVGVRTSDLRLVTLGLEVPTGGERPLSIALELSAIGEPVTITSPPADEVDGAPGG